MKNIIIILFLFSAISPFRVSAESNLNGIAKAVDGRTLVINGETARLQGIDAFPLKQSCKTKHDDPFPCGEVATKALATILRNVKIICKPADAEAPAAPVLLVTCRGGPVDIAEQQVLLGWAFADPETGQRYKRAERAAKALNEGAWKGKFDYPWDWRKQNR
jgi:endonuclease YncB( thermonuclease family)